MAELKRPRVYRASEAADREAALTINTEGAQTVELRDEELVAHKDLRERGEIEVRTVVDEAQAASR